MGIAKLPHLAQIHREFVKQDEGGLAPEQLPESLGTWRDPLRVTVADPFVPFPSSECIRDLAPRRTGQNTVAHRAPVGWVCVLAVKGRDADRSFRKQDRFDELRSVGHVHHAPGCVCKRDKPVSLASAI